MPIYIKILIAIFCAFAPNMAYTQIQKIVVRDANNYELLPFAQILIFDKTDTSKYICDQFGELDFYVKNSDCTCIVMYTGYTTANILCTTSPLVVLLTPSEKLIKEVTVNATESNGLENTSTIKRPAMSHLQPTTFFDLLELLPGGSSKTPNIITPNYANIRSAGLSSNFDQSVGVSIIVDGSPLSNNSNMQYISNTPNTNSTSNETRSEQSSINKGVDLRTIPTDEIEKIEVIKGIASVEYGDMTDGVIKITRQHTKAQSSLRIKADEYGRNISGGYGWQLPNKSSFLNINASYINWNNDPRTETTNYKRYTFSSRLGGKNSGKNAHYNWHMSLDYTGSIDNEKRDPEILSDRQDKFKSSYNKLSFAAQTNITFKDKALQRLESTISVTQSFDYLKKVKNVSLNRPTPVPTLDTDGEADGEYLPSAYLASTTVDGRPLNINQKSVGKWLFGHKIRHLVSVGYELNIEKNWGSGRKFDINRPIYTNTFLRSRNFSQTPAYISTTLFLEDRLNAALLGGTIEAAAGIRANSLLNLPHGFAMRGEINVDPRINILYSHYFADNWKWGIGAGIGRQSKLPTTMQIYPDETFYSIIQLNYYHNDKALRTNNIRTYVIDNSTPEIKPQRNLKTEVRALVSSNSGYDFSVTVFKENMNDALTQTTKYKILSYKTYDTNSLNSGTLTQKPATSDFTFTNDTIMETFNRWANATKVSKTGVEFQISTKRFDSWKTRITANGAWFKTTEESNGPQYFRPHSAYINGKAIGYIGIYNKLYATERQKFNTNILLDTYLDRLRFVFSISMQNQWFTSYQQLPCQTGTPSKYVDINEQTKQYNVTDGSKNGLHLLTQTHSDGYFKKNTVPFETTFNLKSTKKIGKHARLALFVNNIFSICPSYRQNGTLIRRNRDSYFGMELCISSL